MSSWHVSPAENSINPFSVSPSSGSASHGAGAILRQKVEHTPESLMHIVAEKKKKVTLHAWIWNKMGKIQVEEDAHK